MCRARFAVHIRASLRNAEDVKLDITVVELQLGKRRSCRSSENTNPFYSLCIHSRCQVSFAQQFQVHGGVQAMADLEVMSSQASQTAQSLVCVGWGGGVALDMVVGKWKVHKHARVIYTRQGKSFGYI